LLTTLCTRSDLTIEDIKYLEKFCSGSEKLELPLRLGLFISPLYLLIPISLHKMKGRIDIIDVMEVSFRQFLCLI
jgi:hypothetical protein